MAKIKITPIQAHVLKSMVENIEHRPRISHNIGYYHDSVELYGTYRHPDPATRRLTASTVLAMEKLGLLEADNSDSRPGDRHRYLVISDFGKEVAATITEEDLVFKPSKKSELTEKQITEALRTLYDDEDHGWLFYPQLLTSTGGYKSQRIDAYVLNLWPSRKIHSIAFEIKVYRSDFQKEIKEPKKREFAFNHSNEFYFITPAGMLKPEEIPADCGLMEVSRDKTDQRWEIKTIVKATRHEDEPASWWFMTSLCRNMRQQFKCVAPQQVMLADKEEENINSGETNLEDADKSQQLFSDCL